MEEEYEEEEKERSVENFNVIINSSKLKKVEEGDRSVELLQICPNGNVEEGRRQKKNDQWRLLMSKLILPS